jgi:hypothetical protein
MGIRQHPLRSPGRLACLVACGSLLAWHAHAATLVVNNDGSAPYTTIQDAIDAAVPGVDDVFVECGYYVENVVMQDGVSVAGQDTDCVTIDGNLAGPAVLFPHVGSATTFSGFTVTNGGGLAGRGMLIQAGSPVITRNLIRDNGTTTLDASVGGGIAALADGGLQSSPTITHNVIRHNQANQGAGIFLENPDNASVRFNLIAGNWSYDGAGLFQNTGTAEIVHNTIIENRAIFTGGVRIQGSVSEISGNVVVWNHDTWTTYQGIYADPASTVSFSYNDIHGNGTFPDPVGSDGNINADPEFVDASNWSFAGVLPRSFSPLIDGGSPSRTRPFDLRGVSGTVDGNVDGIARIDIGARESEGVTGLRLLQEDLLTWDPAVHDPPGFNVYRGVLSVLESTGIYTQDPGTVLGARHFCDVQQPLSDMDTPDFDVIYYYLVASLSLVEGSIGYDSALMERPKSMACDAGGAP